MEMLSSQRYRLIKDAQRKEERRLLATYIPVIFSILAGSMIISLFLGVWHNGLSQTNLFIAVFIGLYLAYLAFAWPRKIRKNLAKCWESYELEIGPDYFLRRQADTTEIRLRFDEITAVEQLQGRYLRLIGKSKKEVIGIPESIENFEEVLQCVSAVHTITTQSGELWVRRTIYLGIGAVAYLAILWSKSPLVYAPLAVGLSIVSVWTVWSVRHNPNATKQVRRSVLWYLLLLIPCIARMIQGAEALLKR